MSEEEIKIQLRQIIREEMEKIDIDKDYVIKEIHLHLDGKDVDIFRFLERVMSLNNAGLEAKILQGIKRYLKND